MTDDSGVIHEAICQWFSLVTSSLVKTIDISPHSWPKKIVTYGNSCIINLCINILHARINTVRPRQNGLHFPDDIFKYIFINENCCILTRFSFELVTKDPINNVPALVQIMDWHRPGDRPYSEPMVVSWLTYMRLSAWTHRCLVMRIDGAEPLP